MRTSVFIIGSGPAASATALSLHKHLGQQHSEVDVTIVCANDNEKIAIGETIPPAATERLRVLGAEHLLQDGQHILCPGSVSCWGQNQAGHNDFLFTPVGRGYHLNRRRFNQQLFELAIDTGAQILADTKLSRIENKDNHLLLTLTSNGQESTYSSDFIVDATGINSVVARKLGVARNEYDSVVSLCAFVDTQPNDNAAHTLVATAKQGWWYAAKLTDNKAIISLCTDAKTIKQFKLSNKANWFCALQENTWFQRQCEQQFEQKLTPPSTLISRVAPSAILSNVIGSFWLAVGDAASSYDSMTSAGITKALDNGINAGRALARKLIENDETELLNYQQKIFDDFGQYLAMHQQLYQSEQRFQAEGFWQRRQQFA